MLEPQGYRLVWSEEVHPAGQWIARHPKERSAVGLARTVHERHAVELGTLRATTKDGEELPPPEYLTITEYDIPPLPEQDGIPFWDKEWIVPELKDLLFSQPEEGAKLRTYFIVDATSRKNITGVFDLDSGMVDVPVKCLFKGEKAKELKEVAPYLIDMTLPDGAWDDRNLVPSFHKSFFDKHWGKNTGFFICTPALMADVWGHFRKFVRLQREDTKTWIFFRFWDPRISAPYFANISDWSERCSAWFRPRNAPEIAYLVAEAHEGQVAHKITPDLQALSKITALPSQLLFQRELDGFKTTQTNKFDDKIAVKQIDHDEGWLVRFNASKETIAALIAQIRTQSQKAGFITEKGITTLASASLFLGLHFQHDYRFDYHVRSVLQSDSVSEAEKIEKIFALLNKANEAVFFSTFLNEELEKICQSLDDGNLGLSTAQYVFHPTSEQDIERFQGYALSCFKDQELSNSQKITVVRLAYLFGMYWGANPLYHNVRQALLSEDWSNRLIEILRRVISKDIEAENKEWA